MDKQAKLISTPPGSKPFYKKEARFRYAIEKTLTEYFEKWGFSPLEPPIIDYFDVYSPLLNHEQKRNSIRFVDRDGEIVLLRNDITLFAAKFVASRLGQIKECLRYYYSDQIIRCEKNGAPQEYYQIGCEIVGDAFNHQELEAITLLLESLNCLKIERINLHIGDISFYQQLLLPSVSEDDFFEIIHAIRLKDHDLLKDLLDRQNLDETTKIDCLFAAHFIGSLDELKKLPLSQKNRDGLKKLIELGENLTKLGYQDRIIFDLSELSKLDYYNGIIFNCYAEGIETPLASGGRYDLLFKKLDLNKNAVGFSLWLYPLEKILSQKDFFSDQEPLPVSVGKDPVKSIQTAIGSVNQGKKIHLKYD